MVRIGVVVLILIVISALMLGFGGPWSSSSGLKEAEEPSHPPETVTVEDEEGSSSEEPTAAATTQPSPVEDPAAGSAVVGLPKLQEQSRDEAEPSSSEEVVDTSDVVTRQLAGGVRSALAAGDLDTAQAKLRGLETLEGLTGSSLVLRSELAQSARVHMQAVIRSRFEKLAEYAQDRRALQLIDGIRAVRTLREDRVCAGFAELAKRAGWPVLTAEVPISVDEVVDPPSALVDRRVRWRSADGRMRSGRALRELGNGSVQVRSDGGLYPTVPRLALEPVDDRTGRVRAVDALDQAAFALRARDAAAAIGWLVIGLEVGSAGSRLARLTGVLIEGAR